MLLVAASVFSRQVRLRMVQKHLVIFLALSTRWPRSGASFSTKNVVFDGEHVLRDDNQHGGYSGTPGFRPLDADLGDASTIDSFENGECLLNITAPYHPRFDGCYIMRGETPLHGRTEFGLYERVYCEGGGGDSAGGIVLETRGEPSKMTNAKDWILAFSHVGDDDGEEMGGTIRCISTEEAGGFAKHPFQGKLFCDIEGGRDGLGSQPPSEVTVPRSCSGAKRSTFNAESARKQYWALSRPRGDGGSVLRRASSNGRVSRKLGIHDKNELEKLGDFFYLLSDFLYIIWLLGMIVAYMLRLCLPDSAHHDDLPVSRATPLQLNDAATGVPAIESTPDAESSVSAAREEVELPLLSGESATPIATVVRNTAESRVSGGGMREGAVPIAHDAMEAGVFRRDILP